MNNFNNYIQNLQKNIKHGGERSHYSSLQSLIEGEIGISTIVEEKGNQAGIPDLTIRKNERVVGYIEAKDININITKLDKQNEQQIKRYLESNIGYNFILTCSHTNHPNHSLYLFCHCFCYVQTSTRRGWNW
ncbi:hypothetical protein [Anabaena sp. AL93]|uniref:hypothetical protein n=1 Tax=Anabaena sp. AL93 TaxID=1678133 RepID=UPI0007FD6B20|nr:hypothetical protein [Anabaena sp. AL93]OBQ22864.1 MAG: hypothetical protein AN486_01655 [Anabaena sp. AL93]